MTYRILAIVFSLWCSIAWADNMESVRLEQARKYETKGDYDKALEEYRAVLVANPDNAAAYLGAGNARAKLKNYNSALQNYQLAIKKDPKLWAAYEGSAKAYESLGQKEKAVAEWRRLADKGPKDQKQKALDRIGTLLGQDNSAAATKDKASAKSEGKPEAATAAQPSTAKGKASAYDDNDPQFRKALALYQSGDCRKALPEWKKVLDAQPGNPGAFYYAGVCRYNLGEQDKAMYNLKKSVDYQDKGFNAYYYMGRIHEKQNRKADARTAYRQYLKGNPSAQGKAEVQKRLAALGDDTAAQAKSEPAKSESAKTEPAKSEPALPSKENCDLADAKRTKDSLAAALKAKEPRPLTVGPEKQVTMENGRSFVFASSGEAGGSGLQKALKLIEGKSYNQAIEALKAVRREFPNTPNSAAAAHNLVTLYRHLGLSDKVLPTTSSALEDGPPEPYRSALFYQNALALKDKGDYAAALAELDSIKPDQALGPTNGQKLALAGDIAAKYKPSPMQATDQLRQQIAQETDPSVKADRKLDLANLLAKQDDRGGAAILFKEVLDSCVTQTQKQCRTAVYALADMSYQSRNWPMALEYYQKASTNFRDKENTPWALYQIGNIHRQQKRYSESVAAYDRLIKEFPGNYWSDQGKWNRDDVLWQEKNQKVLGRD